ncbi:hypothetical protein H074_25687 [Amycolatopsis decaplanina DSM 44594]|uniref:Uncharacterized protein n=1 Tax=Amycolatopsis decaplanina DSM 44594 TaxID=1284240 RepID=M2Z2X1_9PSEU|nr:hypothetical protein H074_25687 [Amycolatopsis decaplanina DSM 44594]
MACVRIGASLVVHGPGGITAQARELASSVPADPEHVLVVVDQPDAGASSIADGVRTVLGEEVRPLRLFPSAEAGVITLVTAQKLADRIGRTVIYPDGVVLASASGLCFLPPFEANGWIGCGPGSQPVRLGRRYPSPEWEGPATTDPQRAGQSTVVEPLPAGVWLRPDGPQRWLEADRARLSRWLSVRPRELTAVLGGHGIPPLALDDVVKWWAVLPPESRSRTRFLSFGDVPVPSHTTLGQALADALGEEIVLYGGLPVGAPATPEFFTLRLDGSHSFRTFAEEITFSPRRGATKAAAPQIRRGRLPFKGLIEVGPGVYQYEADSVVEVVQAGLWLRTAREPARAAEVRTMPYDPKAFLVFHDPAVDGHDALVAKLLDRLDGSIRAGAKPFPVPSAPEPRQTDLPFAADLTAPLTPLPRLSRLLRRHLDETEPPEAAAAPAPEMPYLPVELGGGQEAASAPSEAEPLSTPQPERQPEPEPKAGAQPAPEPQPQPAPQSQAEPEPEPEPEPLAVQSTPSPELRAWPLNPGFAADRGHIRAGREDAFDALSAQIAETWRRFSPNRPMSDNGLTEAVAAGLYLAGDDPDVDAGLRAGTRGPHVEFGRCVAAGLQKLPVHRNVAATVVTPAPELWALLHGHATLREWGFLNLLTVPGEAEQGSTDLVVWSVTGRLTALIEPKDEGLLNRVVFLPGTGFKVLDVVEPRDKERGRILMRELVASEVGADGGSAGSTARDDLIRSSLRRFAGRSAGAKSRRPSGARSARPGRIPGIADPPSRKNEL